MSSFKIIFLIIFYYEIWVQKCQLIAASHFWIKYLHHKNNLVTFT